MDSRAASIGFVNKACLPPLRLHDGAAFQQTQFQIGDESIESVRKQLTIETNFSLKIPDPIRPRSTLEEFRVITIRLQAVQSMERCSMKRKSIGCGIPGLSDCAMTRKRAT
jgi:hypothetical protein